MATQTKKQVNQLVQQIRELCISSAENAYELAQVLNAVQQGKLFEVVGYESFKDFLDNADVLMGYSTACKYTQTYRHLVRLKYTRQESTEILGEFGVTGARHLISQMEKKVAISTLRRRQVAEGSPIINFALAPDEILEVDTALEKYGMRYHDSGQRSGSANALLNLVRAVNGKRSKAA